MDLKICQPQAVGDNICATALLRDLRAAGHRIWAEFSHPEILAGNPHIEHSPCPRGIRTITARYKVELSYSGMHFCHSWHEWVRLFEHIDVERGEARGVLVPVPLPDRLRYLLESPYIVLDAGYKIDFTAKHWGTSRYAAVVEMLPQYRWVQIGAARDKHKPIPGAIDLIGQTSLAELIALINHAAGTLTPVSCPAHIAGALGRPCVTIAGGREPASWESYPDHVYFCTYHEGEPPCWRSNILGECRHPLIAPDGETTAACMGSITPEMVAEAINGNFGQSGGQAGNREYQALASGGRAAGPIEIRCGETRCGGQGISGQQPTKRADRRNRSAVRESRQNREGARGPEKQELLVERVRREMGMVRSIPSWRRRGMDVPKAERRKKTEWDKDGATYFSCNCALTFGDCLGDMVTLVSAMHTIWDAERPARSIVSLYRDEPLNFLWDRFISLSKARVVYDAKPKTLAEKHAMLDQRRAARDVDGIQFANYKECYRRLCADQRYADLGAGSVNVSHSIVELYYYGQEYHLQMVPYWGVGPRQYDPPLMPKAKKKPVPYVLVSPREKCQQNRHFSIAFWRQAIKELLKSGARVIVNDNTEDFDGAAGHGDYWRTFEPFQGLFAQVAGASCVLCGNTGTMWLAAAAGTPSVICESPDMIMPEYSAHRNRLAGVRYVIPQPDLKDVIARTLQVARGEA